MISLEDSMAGCCCYALHTLLLYRGTVSVTYARRVC